MIFKSQEEFFKSFSGRQDSALSIERIEQFSDYDTPMSVVSYVSFMKKNVTPVRNIRHFKSLSELRRDDFPAVVCSCRNAGDVRKIVFPWELESHAERKIVIQQDSECGVIVIGDSVESKCFDPSTPRSESKGIECTLSRNI